MSEQILALGALILSIVAVVVLLGELLLAWASTALVDAAPSLLRLCLFVLLALALTAGAYFGGTLLLRDLSREWTAAASAEGKSPWSLYALHHFVFMLCSLIVVVLLAGPVFGLTARQSFLVGVFIVLLRILLWSLIFGGIFAVLGFLQGYRGTPPKATEQRTAQVVLVAPPQA